MKIIKRILLLILIIIIIASAFIIFRGYNMYEDVLEDETIEEKFKEVQSMENFTSINEVPEIFINAIVSAEDKRFYKHNGVDLISIGRAAITDIQELSFEEGGSTITQQIAKNIYFTQDKNLYRKVAEVFVARDIEKLYTKDEILEIYININFYGSGYYGIYDASMGYFEKEPCDLTDYEATLLAGVPNAPSVYSPKVNLSLSEQRQSVVLNDMVESGYIDEIKKAEIESEQKTK